MLVTLTLRAFSGVLVTEATMVQIETNEACCVNQVQTRLPWLSLTVSAAESIKSMSPQSRRDARIVTREIRKRNEWLALLLLVAECSSESLW